ncbi:MAG: GNAT family N-acetyltransferase [Bacteroidetes bacterium]|nr:GNAT family N-acetyltransferase [Bacteroidota bacterium]
MSAAIPKLRQAHLSDLPELVALARTSFVQAFTAGNKPENVQAYLSQAFTVEQLTKEIQELASTFMVASWEGKLVGYTKLNLAAAQAEVQDPDSVEVARLYTLEEVWGKGVGQLLLDAAIAYAKREGKTWLWLGVWEHNVRAIRFYKKNGLRIFGSHPFPFGDEIQNDWLMRVDWG